MRPLADQQPLTAVGGASKCPPRPRRPRNCSPATPPAAAWNTKPSLFSVANNDMAVNPELERFCAKRMNATTHDIDSSHVPMLSHPDFVIDVIRDAIKGV
jgi:pimeloyl-ACP methyl ester carboxylesterase